MLMNMESAIVLATHKGGATRRMSDLINPPRIVCPVGKTIDLDDDTFPGGEQ